MNIKKTRQELDPSVLHQLTDEQLMEHYRDGTAAAFDELYARHKGGLYRFFLRQLNNQAEIADELFQQVWMKLIKSRASYQVSAKFNTYLYRIAQNSLIDYWRSPQHRTSMSSYEENVSQEAETDELQNELACERAQPQHIVQQQQDGETLKQAIASLPEEQRSALLLKEEGALSLEEIAHITGVNRETVKSRLRYGIQRLRHILQPLRSIS